MRPESAPKPSATEDEVERLSEDLKQQVELAKDRISDRYGKLMETRSFEPRRWTTGQSTGA